MKVVLLAGGRGSRFGEITKNTPKPLLTIGGKPILWHVMKIYSYYGYKDFVLGLGYKSEAFKDYFRKEDNEYVNSEIPIDWNVDWVVSGDDVDTGGRIKSISHLIKEECFLLSWGDIVSDINISALKTFHDNHGREATVTAIPFRSKFGLMSLYGNQVSYFDEKPIIPDKWINGAFFVLNSDTLELIDDESTKWEKEPMNKLAESGELMAYKHKGFWQCMDTPQERQLLEELWESGNAPWKIWN